VMPLDLPLPKGGEWGPFFGPQKSPLIFKPLGVDVSRGGPVGNNYTGIVRLQGGVPARAGNSRIEHVGGGLRLCVQG
ncbi:MAG: hypothetical protein ACRD9L_14195, partial [Bryobacteraceae bacterium]